jgi:branched-subunit amino acid ABC-type transport system permease component
MQTWILLTAGAATNAAIYALIALSLVLVYRGSGVINFGVGYAAVFAGLFFANGRGGWIGLATALVVGGVVGLAMYLVAVRMAERAGASHAALAVSTLGFGMILEFAAGRLWAKHGFTAKPLWGGSVSIGSVEVSHQRILTVLVAGACFVLVLLLLERSMIGWAMEAVAFKRDVAAAYGVSPLAVMLFVWLLAGAIAALAGSLLAPVSSVSRDVALPLAIQGFAAAVVGGLGSVGGAVVGAVVVAGLQAVVVQYVSTGFASAFAFLLLFVVLAVRPQGLMGGQRVVRTA